jgi:hypothetical protein
MWAVKNIKDKGLKVPSIPWPVLTSRFPLVLTDTSLSTEAFPANLQDFVSLYSKWKKLTVKQTSTAMLSDWVLISNKLKKKRKGGKVMTDMVIRHLRIISM